MRRRPKRSRSCGSSRSARRAGVGNDAATIVALLERIARAVEGLRADLRREARSTDRAVDALIDALVEYFGPAPFTVAGLRILVTDDPSGPIGEAISRVVDLNATPRAWQTALSRRL